jgi:cytochrome c oxidase assembly protein subunit 15
MDKKYAENNSTNEQEQKEEICGEEYERRVKPVKIWLFTLSGLVFLIIIVGGLTRLEEGGLSMVTWTPLGSLPPMNQQQWEEEFERYKQFPEYQKKNYGMSLDEFKYIYWYEYSHRMLGRLIGLTFAVPAVLFASKGWIRFKNSPNRILSGGRVLLIGSLIGFQGLLGWYMVKSGLDSEHRLMKEYNTVPRVSQYRLASHLITAFTIYGLCVWTLLDILSPRRIATSLSNIDPSVVSRLKALSRNSLLLTALIFVTAASGAFVAGMDAGLVYNEFPLMGGKLIPSDIGALVPWWKNCFENATTVQFQHRLLATLTSLSIGLLYLQNRFMHKTSWTMLPPQVRLALNAMTIVVAIQYSLGITTLLNYVPTPLASAHQIGSLSLFTVAVYFLHVMKRIRL